jgi:peptidoglycan/LPS O-acetylase OafA/YrhL
MISSQQFLCLKDQFNPKSNSIGFLRFFLATLVVFSHSFLLAHSSSDPLGKWSIGDIDLGDVSVECFFALSGFLIAGSYFRTSDLWRYFWHRSLRIFPGFWACLVVIAFLIGPFVYLLKSGSIAGYFNTGSENPFAYVTANLFLFMRNRYITGLFTDNPYPSVVNDSLRTLSTEFVCYVAIIGLGILFSFKKSRAIVLGLFCLCLLLYNRESFSGLIGAAPSLNINFPRLPLFFLGGVVFFLYQDRIILNSWLCAIATLLSLVGLKMGFYNFIGPLLLPYMLFWLAIHLPFKNFEKSVGGDYSYGIYIYAYPIQQSLTSLGFNHCDVVALSLKLCCMGQNHEENPARQGFAVISS